MDPYLQALLHLIGYGKPQKSKVFVFGIEEKLTDEDSLPLKEFYINEFNLGKSAYYTLNIEDIYEADPNLEARQKSLARENRFYTMVTKISNRLLSKDEQVKNEDLGSKNSKVFIGNYSFISRKSTNSKTSKDEEIFFKNNLSKRKELLKNFFLSVINEGKYVITLGMMAEYVALLGNDKDFNTIHFDKTLSARGKYYRKKDPNIYLFYHPSYNWLSEKQIETIKFD